MSSCLAFLISPAQYIHTCLMGFLLFSQWPHGNFNVTRGKTTHDMTGVWGEKHLIVKVWAILSFPMPLLESSSDHQSHWSPMPWITQKIICTELFFSLHSHPSNGWLCTVSWHSDIMLVQKHIFLKDILPKKIFFFLFFCFCLQLFLL